MLLWKHTIQEVYIYTPFPALLAAQEGGTSTHALQRLAGVDPEKKEGGGGGGGAELRLDWDRLYLVPMK